MTYVLAHNVFSDFGNPIDPEVDEIVDYCIQHGLRIELNSIYIKNVDHVLYVIHDEPQDRGHVMLLLIRYPDCLVEWDPETMRWPTSRQPPHTKQHVIRPVRKRPFGSK